MLRYAIFTAVCITGIFTMGCRTRMDKDVSGIGAKGFPVLLAKNGEPAAAIVVADQPLEQHRKAAELIRDYIRKASGAELPLVTASEAPLEGALLLVGRSALSKTFDLALPTEPEGTRIVTFPRGVAVLGEIAPAGTNNRAEEFDRGTLHAAYRFLENHVGCRFYFDRGPNADLGIVVPDRSTLVVEPVDETSAPAFPYRQIHGWRQDMLLAGSATGFTCNHTHVAWDKYYKEKHPEYFSLNADGSRNFRSLCYGNPDVLKRELEHIDTYFKTGKWVGWRPPTEKYIRVESVDNWSECQCDRCQQWIDPEAGRFGKHSRLWWDHYIHNLALAVKERWPDKRIAALAYQGRLWPGKKELPDNVDLFVCIHNAPTNFYQEPSARREINKLLDAWSRKVGGDRERLYVWDYSSLHFWTCAPTINPHVMQRFLQNHRKQIGGVFINSASETVQGAHFMVALKMRMKWNPELDVDAYLRDYCRTFFGPGADAMERVYRLLIERYENTRWPGYHPHGYASPVMLYGHTYTPDVIETVEQNLREAQDAVGELPGGRPVEFEGEGWFVRRNAGNKAMPYEIVLEAPDQPVHSPTLRWNSGEITYRGTLERGQRLVVAPGPRATLQRVTPPPPQEVKRLVGEMKESSSGYRVYTAGGLDMTAFPGATFRVTVSGKAEGGANSQVSIQWSNGKWSHCLQNRFDSEQRTVSQLVTAPDGALGAGRINLYRKNKKGTIWYGDLSLKRVFPEKPAQDLPPEGKDVTADIEGDAPVIPARTTVLFHAFSDSPAPGVLRGEKMDVHDAGDAAVAEGTADSDAAAGGGAILGITVQPEEQGIRSADDRLPEPTIYQRRVAWMRDGWENFHPASSMYATHDGWLVAARIAHGSMGSRPRNRVENVQGPITTLTDPKWSGANTIELVRGRSRASVPVENLGFPAGNSPTLVRLLQDEKNLYAAFQCFQPEQPNDRDSVTLTLYNVAGRRSSQVFSVTLQSGGTTETESEGVTGKTVSITGGWAALLTIPKSAVNGGLRAEHGASLLRTRRGGRSYQWSPPLDAPWNDNHRLGRLQFGKQ